MERSLPLFFVFCIACALNGVAAVPMPAHVGIRPVVQTASASITDGHTTADADVMRLNYNKHAPKPAPKPRTTVARPLRRAALLAQADIKLEPR